MIVFLPCGAVAYFLVNLKIMTEVGKANFVNDKRLDLNVVTALQAV